ncbi:MAG TPA: DUF4168 domain-containing protein [Balneolaceae bacterium]|nr:DUF4168 domain-containing protein [Balneolaceae bacterium]
MKKLKSVVLFVALMGGVSAFAQVPQQQQQDDSKTEVKDSELEQFASIYQEVMAKNQEVNQEVAKKIEDEGLTVERYQEMRKAEMDPSSDAADATADEKEKKKNIDDMVQKAQKELQEAQVDIIKKSDVSLERYQQIAMALNSDSELQQRFQKLLMKQDGGDQ